MSASSAVSSSPADGGTRVPGRVRVRERVLEKVARETAAAVVGVDRDEVDVDVDQWRGGLALRVNTKFRIPDLGDVEALRGAPSMLDRLGDMQRELQSRVAHVTSRDVHRVAVTVSGAIVAGRKRVR